MKTEPEYITLDDAANALNVDFETIRQALIVSEIRAGAIFDRCSGRWCIRDEQVRFPTDLDVTSFNYGPVNEIRPDQSIDIQPGGRDLISGYWGLSNETILQAIAGKPAYPRILIPLKPRYGKIGTSNAYQSLIFELDESPRPIRISDLKISQAELIQLKGGVVDMPAEPKQSTTTAPSKGYTAEIETLIAALYYMKFKRPRGKTEAEKTTIYDVLKKNKIIDLPAPKGFHTKVSEISDRHPFPPLSKKLS